MRVQHVIVVIGGSAGSLEPLRMILGGLPPDFTGSVFVVVHLSPEFPSMLDELASRWGPLPASFPPDYEAILPRRIYLAPPDRHLLIEQGRIRLDRGPRENRHRPAIDPLFRSAARVYGSRVVGILLSGLRDDGSAGLYAVKQRGGIAVVQDPEDAVWREMPDRALKYARPQFVLQPRDIASKIVELATGEELQPAMSKESHLPNGSPVPDRGDENLHNAYHDEGEGTPSVFACPECHGVLWELKDGNLIRFRCRVGHAYGTESLSDELTQASESALWAAMRALEEKAAMHRRMAGTLAGDSILAKRFREESADDDANAHTIREMIFRRDVESEIDAQQKDVQHKKKIA
jgi:two-component system, chemotaxis family, protein-glutamate methylesterase/glutaminase